MQQLPTNLAELMVLLADYKMLVILSTLSFSLITTLVVMPRIIAISKIKNLTADINGRTSHVGIVPTLGGIGVFIGVLLTTNIVGALFATHNQLVDLIIVNILLLVLLLVGVCDDIMIMRARKKFLFQILIATIFTLGTGIYIDSFLGLFGLHGLDTVIGMGFSIFVIVLIINAYNLIDGIDGLAGSVGAFISIIMGVMFYLSGHFLAALISVSLVGALVAFLVHNFSHKRKIFLGDTGSMVVGFVLAFQVVLYLSFSAAGSSPVFNNAPLLVLALLSYPLLDTLRVFIVRIKKGQSPFIADRNHIHHRLIDLGLSHKFATLVVVFYTAIVTLLAYLLNDMPINAAFAILLPVCMILVGLPFVLKLKEDCSRVWFPFVLKAPSNKEA